MPKTIHAFALLDDIAKRVRELKKQWGEDSDIEIVSIEYKDTFRITLTIKGE